MKGRKGSTTTALPGMVRSFEPDMMMVNLSVVGSGPIRQPGYSRPSKCFIKVVFPVEYCPIKRTIGRAENVASV